MFKQKYNSGIKKLYSKRTYVTTQYIEQNLFVTKIFFNEDVFYHLGYQISEFMFVNKYKLFL